MMDCRASIRLTSCMSTRASAMLLPFLQSVSQIEYSDPVSVFMKLECKVSKKRYSCEGAMPILLKACGN
jgi:hypothetical protein